MKLCKSLILITAIFLLTLPVTGCHSEATSEVSPARKACIELMQKVPVYYDDFEFWDVGDLRDDPDLGEMYQVWYKRRVDFLEERYGIESKDIDYLAQGEGLEIYTLDYDIDAFRDRINPYFYRDIVNEDIEVWKSQPSHDPQSATGGWVLAEGLLTRGANNSNIDDYLLVVSGEELSMYDRNTADLLEMLPQGVMTRIMRNHLSKGSIISGMSVKKEGDDSFMWTNVDMFESAGAAENAEASEYYQRIEDSYNEALILRGESSPLHGFSLERKGQFIQWSVLAEVKYMIALLFYG